MDNQITSLKQIKELLDNDAITQAEFEKLKAEILTQNNNTSSNKNTNTIKVLLFILTGLLIVFLAGFYFFNPSAKYILVPYLKSNGKYIYVDSATMKVKIDKEYDKAELFIDGIALTKKESKYYFINKEGMQIGQEYEDARSFSEGFAAVKKAGKWGFINIAGQNISDYVYDHVEDFKNGFAVVAKSNKNGLINNRGLIKIKCTFDDLSDYSEGFCVATYHNSSLSPYPIYGFVDTLGYEKKLFEYDFVGSFKNGISVVGKYWTEPNSGDFYDEEMKLGIINKSFNLLSPLEFLNCYWNTDELIAVKKNNLWGYIDKNTNVMLPYQFEEASVFNDNIAVVKSNGQNCLINKNGEFIFKSNFDEIRDSYDDMLAFSSNGKWGYLNSNGQVVVQNIYDPLSINEIGIEEVGAFKNGFTLVSLNKKSFYIDKTGREFVEL